MSRKENRLPPRRSSAESGPPSTDRPCAGRHLLGITYALALAIGLAQPQCRPCAADSVCSPASQEEGVTPGSPEREVESAGLEGAALSDQGHSMYCALTRHQPG
jgi:hypothetical protein